MEGSILLAVLGLAALATTVGVPPLSSSGTIGASSIPLGDYAGWTNASGIAAFGATTGTHPTLATDYLDRNDGWSQMDSGGGEGAWAGSGYRLVLGVPMIPGSSGGTLAQGATGAYDQYFATLAQNLVAQGESNAILRLGWEFNGNWYPWSVASNTDAQNFAAFWRQIVNTMRGVTGQQFSFLWNPNGGGTASWDLTQAYPGSAYVDYIGTDVYDEYWGTPQTPQNSWANAMNQSWGLNWLSSFAASQGRPIAMPEWSVTIRTDGHGLGDDPYFVDQFANWVSSNNVAFTNIFSFNDTAGGQDNDITDGNFPNSLAAFKADFGGIGGTVPNATTTTTSAASPAPTSPTTAASTSPAHVMVVMMENKNYSDVIGQSNQPFTNSLATQYGLATQSYAVNHPSLPNYLDIVSGQDPSNSTDDGPPSSHTYSFPTLADQFATAGTPEKAYAENLPADPTNDSGEYAVRHFPWAYFPGSTSMPVADASTLTTDLNSSSPPDFVWYTPNLINDEHDGSVQQGDAFLSSFIPSVQGTSWYKAGGQIVVTWDESNNDNSHGGGNVATIVVSDALKSAPHQSTTFVSTTGLLHSIEDAYGLSHLGGGSSDGTIDSLLSAPPTPPPTTTTTTTTAPTTTTTVPTTSPTTTPTTTTPTVPTTSPTTTAPSTSTTTTPVGTTTTTAPPASPSTPTSISLSLIPDAATSAQDLTATVTPAPDAGSVRFIFDGADLGALPVSRPGGTITLAIDMPTGSHVVNATYSGSSAYDPSTISKSFVITQAPSVLWVAPPARVGTTGASFSLNASLSSGNGPISGALVWFAVPGTELCSGTTDAAGKVSCNENEGGSDQLGLATRGVSATYGGDPTHLPVSAHSTVTQGGTTTDGVLLPGLRAARTAPPTSASGSPGSSASTASASSLVPGVRSAGHGPSAPATTHRVSPSVSRRTAASLRPVGSTMPVSTPPSAQATGVHAEVVRSAAAPRRNSSSVVIWYAGLLGMLVVAYASFKARRIRRPLGPAPRSSQVR